MFQKRMAVVIISLLVFVTAGLIGCQLFEGDDSTTPTSPETGGILGNYAQMQDGSVVVNGHQLNWVISEWGSMPYGSWMYLEVNEQDAVGQQPGENQVTVTLSNVVLNFSGLPETAREIVIGVKAARDDADQTFTERGRFAVVGGSVSIPLHYADLVSYFGVTHYSIWFQALGGKNGNGTACGQIVLSGAALGGQTVTFSKQICFGTNPATVTPSVTPSVICVPAAAATAPASTITASSTLLGPYGSGSIAPTGTFQCPNGSVAMFTVTPGTTTCLCDLRVDGTSVKSSVACANPEGVNYCTVLMTNTCSYALPVTGNHTVIGTFAGDTSYCP